jgi:broad specificity phosphatase PhoE
MHVKIRTESLPNQFIFCRHAESVGNARDLDDNSTKEVANHKFELSPKGQREVVQTSDFIHSYFPNSFAEHYISTFFRTQATFGGIFDEHVIPFEDPRLDEWWKGIFHSLSKEEIERYYPAEAAVLQREGWYHYRPPQGESGKDVEMRILSFLSSLNPVDDVFICGHGRWFNFFERLLLQLPREEMNTEAPKNCSVIALTKKDDRYESQVLFTPQ